MKSKADKFDEIVNSQTDKVLIKKLSDAKCQAVEGIVRMESVCEKANKENTSDGIKMIL
jgi:hypothetical protein